MTTTHEQSLQQQRLGIPSNKNNWDTRLVMKQVEKSQGVSPASRLPHDMLLEIFQQYHSPGAPIRVPFKKHRPAGPFTFSHVCQDWRNAALNTTAAWVSLHVEIAQDLSTMAAKRVCDLINICTTLSSNRPLDLRLSIYARTAIGQSEADYESINAISVQIVFLELIRHSQRWRKFFLGAPYAALDEIMAYDHLSPNLPTPLLQAFHLQSESEYDASRPAIPDAPYFSCDSAPSLRMVSLFDDALFWVDGAAFPWRQLEELNLGGTCLGLTLREYREILQGCESLRRCRLSIAANRREEPIQPVVPVVLCAMESLVIVDHSLPAQHGDIYRALGCPKLKDLTVRYTRGDGCRDEMLLWAGEALAAMLKMSKNIQRLHLSTAPLTERGLIHVLKDHPTISHLTVANGKHDTLFGDQALFELTVLPPHALLPMLERISIASRRCSGRYIEEFIASRRTASCTIATLQHLRFDSLGSVMEPSLPSRLKWACDEGLVLGSVNSG